ncbi:uracil-DNA glycosylase [Candidatus Babeliales bacterium]|nr:uracil-DNA glycosylase [Candidatus Babeliales bacterium]
MLSRNKQLLNVQKNMQNCTQCPLATCGRTNVVHGEGDINPDFFLIGEAPGAAEEIEGRPFVGRSGQLLRAILLKLLPPETTYYISNTVKCRPPKNRNPTRKEKTICTMLGIFKEIEIVNPRIIITVGAVALSTVLPSAPPLLKAREIMHLYKGFPLIPALHPAYCLRFPSKKKELEQDILFALKSLQEMKSE